MNMLACCWTLFVICFHLQISKSLNSKVLKLAKKTFQVCNKGGIREENHVQFANFVRQYRKVYRTPDECTKRYDIFRRSVMEAERLNKRERGTAKYGVTKFSDMTKEEFKKFLGLNARRRMNPRGRRVKVSRKQIMNAPKEIDWRKEGAVNSIRDQGDCGACYAFSAVASVEGTFAVKYGILYKFSEQVIVDCDRDNSGCSSGWPDLALHYLQSHGIMLEKDYPYNASTDPCRYETKSALKVPMNVKLLSDKEDEIAAYLAENGPLSAGISSQLLGFYAGGIINSECSDHLDHSVAIVGYGVEKNGSGTGEDIPYWIGRNSWNYDWGEQGYFRMVRGKGLCAINQLVETCEFY